MSNDPVRIEVVNLDEWKEKLKRLDVAVSERAVVRALTAGAEIIQNDAKRRAPYKTGTLKRSIHIEQGDGMEVLIGTDAPYAAIQEFGGTITPKKAKMLAFEIKGELVFAHSVTIPARPYLRPAFDENKDAAIKEVGEALAQLLEAAT